MRSRSCRSPTPGCAAMARSPRSPSTELVPGDVVLVEAGDLVPADGRLITSATLEVQEAALTGESAPVAKDPGTLAAGDVALGDRTNMVFQNTQVTRGSAVFVVTATGAATQMGHIADMVTATKRTKSPLQRELDGMTKVFGFLAWGAVAIIAVVGIARGQDGETLALLCISTAIASIPTGLPTFVQTMLSSGAQRLADGEGRREVARRRRDPRRHDGHQLRQDRHADHERDDGHVDVRRRSLVSRSRAPATRRPARSSASPAPTCPTSPRSPSGCRCARDATVGRRRLRHRRPHRGRPRRARRQDGRGRRGDPQGDPPPDRGSVRLRLQVHGHLPRPARDDARVRSSPEPHFVAVKGGPDVVLDRCIERAARRRARPDRRPARRDPRRQPAAVRAGPARPRVRREGPRRRGDGRAPAPTRWRAVNDLVLVGLVGIIDPLRPEAADAVHTALGAGIDVRMITGDHTITARAIADQLGLGAGVITGTELQHMSDEEVVAALPELHVFGRVAPEDKLRLARLMQEAGEVVAMTGDAVNDAAALKQADIGVAMGSGSEVSKQAAKIVLTDDNFATLVRAVDLGRDIYRRISSYIKLQLTILSSVLQLMLLATIFNINGGVALFPMQLLFCKFFVVVTVVVGFIVDVPDPGVMDLPPRKPGTRIVNRPQVVRWAISGFLVAVSRARRARAGAPTSRRRRSGRSR